VEVRRDDVKVPLLDLFLGQRRICGERRLLAIAGGPFQGPEAGRYMGRFHDPRS